MSLYHINPKELPQVWPIVAPLLQKAIDVDTGSNTIEQVEYSVRTGRINLLVWDDPTEGIIGAVTVSFVDYPRARVGHIDLAGGSGIVNMHIFEEVKRWMRLNGATKAQCWANGARVRLYEKIGMKNTHQVMRVDL